jgi:AmmeMemoRadiSam system protein A
MLTGTQRSRLLQIARESIETALAGGRPDPEPPEDAALKQPSGVFVTLRTPDLELRGCIGSIYADAPLFQAVSRSALNAAFRDPRFPPVSPAEWSGISIEISVMSPIVPVESPDEILPGRDGLIVRSGNRAGLLLPQVATEYGWDRETFLAQTCRKAGLPSDAWRSPETRIERFSAEVFAEPTH